MSRCKMTHSRWFCEFHAKKEYPFRFFGIACYVNNGVFDGVFALRLPAGKMCGARRGVDRGFSLPRCEACWRIVEIWHVDGKASRSMSSSRCMPVRMRVMIQMRKNTEPSSPNASGGGRSLNCSGSEFCRSGRRVRCAEQRSRLPSRRSNRGWNFWSEEIDEALVVFGRRR